MTATSPQPTYYPMFLNIAGKECVVIGGGQIALRKVRMLLEFGARVTTVSPDLCQELEGMAERGDVCAIRRDYRTGDLREATVAVAATSDNDTNQRVSREARERRVLVNVVDDAAASDFIVPAYVHRGDVTLAVSTAGRSPALARRLRAMLEDEFGDEYGALAQVIGEVRAEIKRRGLQVHADAWQAALDLERLTEMVRHHDSDGARTLLLDALLARPRINRGL